jgi:hypothetical protein
MIHSSFDGRRTRSAVTEGRTGSLGKPLLALCFALAAFARLPTVVHAGRLTLTSEPVVPLAAVVTYDASDGNLSYDGNGYPIQSMELISSRELFDPSKVNADVIVAPFDVFTPAKFFKLVTQGVESVDIGPVLPAGLSAEELLDDLQINGGVVLGFLSDMPGGGPYLYVIPVPEPSSLTLLACGLLGLLRLRRK